MRRVVIASAMMLLPAGLGCARAVPPPASPAEPAATQQSPFAQPGALARVFWGRQDNETAYVAIVLGQKPGEPCGATTVPERLKVPRPSGPVPRKLRVEWEIVNHCWTAGERHEVTLSFANEGRVIQRWLKQAAEMSNTSDDPRNRDTIRAALRLDASRGTYNYRIMLKRGDGQPVAVVDPELEVEY
jgi:hypothetical protein